MDQIITASSATLEENGRRVYHQNRHFRRLATIMEHPEFREFYNEYLKDWENVKSIVMFMKLYEAIESHSKVPLTPFQKLSVLRDIMENGETRRQVCQGMNEWTKPITERPDIDLSSLTVLDDAADPSEEKSIV